MKKLLILLLLVGCTANTAPAKPAAPVDAPKPTVAAVSPTIAPTTAPVAPTIGKVGERIESAGIALTISKVERKTALDTIQKAKTGNTFVTFDALIENTGRDKAAYNLLYFKAKDADGYEYNSAISGLPNTLKAGEIVAGDKVRGIVVFEVPEKASGLVVSYEPIVVLGGYKPIRVALQ